MDIASYITGFSDGEGCFSVSFTQRRKMNFGIEVKPSFSLSQNKRNLEIIKLLESFFGCGGIRFSKRDQNYKFEVRSLSDLNRKVIPHFEGFPLQTSKIKDYKFFREICELMKQSKHLSREGLIKIIYLAYQMNESGKRKYSKKELLKYVTR